MTRRASGTRARLLLDAHRSEIPRGSTVLDIGCGNGVITRRIAETCGCEIRGADVENLLDHDVPFYPITNGRIDVPDRSFDIALYTDVLHHIDKPRQARAIREALRVANKVLIFEQHPTLMAKILDVAMAYMVYAGHEPLPLSHRRPEEWTTLITRDVEATCRVKHLTSPMLYPLRHFAITVERPHA